MPTARTYDARNKLTKFLLQDTPNNKGDLEESNYTKNVSMSHSANNTKDDFSIFIDNSATTQKSTTTNENQLQREASQQKKQNEETAQVFFDPTTVKDLHSRASKAVKDDKQQQQHSRKPLGVLAADDETSFAMPNFELTDTTLLTTMTTTSTTTKFVNFDPCLASTRFFKANHATTTNTNCSKAETDLEKEMQEMNEEKEKDEEEEEAEKEKVKLLSDYLQKNGGENNKKSSWSSNTNNNTTTESPRMATEKEAESGESMLTKKIKFTDTTLSTAKTFKTMKWDNYGHENTTTQENESPTQSDLTKILSPSNKLFSDKTEKLNFNKQPKFDTSNFACESMIMTTTTTTGHYNVNQDFKNNYYMLCPSIDITPSQTDSVIMANNKSLTSGGIRNRTINDLEQPVELTSKLGGVHKIEESLLLADIQTTLVEDDFDEKSNLIARTNLLICDESLTSEAMEQSFTFGFKKNFQSHLITDTDASSALVNMNNTSSRILNKSVGIERMFSQLKNKSVNLEQPTELGVSCLQRIEESELAETNTTSTTALDVEDEDACSEHNTTTNLNETILQSIRNPFSYEFKNRLLKRCGGVDYLKTKSTYTSLMSNAPIIKEKRNVFLAGNTNYNVIKEIGKGSYAVIYAITNKNETCALKVCYLILLIKIVDFRFFYYGRVEVLNQIISGFRMTFFRVIKIEIKSAAKCLTFCSTFRFLG
jgi:hypothetical protein